MNARNIFFFSIVTLFLALPILAENSSFSGKWETSFGELAITEQDGNASGTYQIENRVVGELQGKVSGTTLTFTYKEGEITGEGEFVITEDGRSLNGRRRQKDKEEWQECLGKRIELKTIDFNGVWKSNYGLIRLIQDKDKVIGCYEEGGLVEIEGKSNDGVLTFTFIPASGKRGTGEFKLSEDGSSFTGTWKTDDNNSKGEWTATKVTPSAGKTWLIILEAHWEKTLQEPEYAYGEMLQQFFTRVPEVSIRHRYFDEKEDFAKWSSELSFIAEPTVLYVSSHGTKDGITVGEHVLDGEFIGHQLRYAPAVKLVHLGACSAMAGDVPNAIRKSSGGSFPVSGFTKDVDWAGSAVVDFAYLDLVLSHGIKPGTAVRQIRENVSFATEKENPKSPIAPMDLIIVE